MGVIGTAFFLARGRSLEGCRKFKEKRSACLKEWEAFVASVGGSGSVRYGTGDFAGVNFAKGDEVDKSIWRRDQKLGCYVPNRKKAEGKEMAERILALPSVPTQWELWKYAGLLHQSDEPFNGVRDGLKLYPKCLAEELVDGTFLLHVRFSDNSPLEVPPEATELKASEYEALVARSRKGTKESE